MIHPTRSENPISRWKTLPFTAPIPGDYLGMSKKVIIHGKLGSRINWIEFSLASDAEGTEYPILFRIENRNIFAKYYQSLAWTNYASYEQTNEYPLKDNEPFTFEIERNSGGYSVSINGKPFHNYAYYLDRELARYIHISGDADFSINLIEFKNTIYQSS